MSSLVSTLVLSAAVVVARLRVPMTVDSPIDSDLNLYMDDNYLQWFCESFPFDLHSGDDGAWPPELADDPTTREMWTECLRRFRLTP
ncbi:Aste57867_23559 [Aphanomyces stellatus]|uniref:Aste57867_23559 protein n=1 Tax=Aphanomyces stellatus TaxID=120398 RepID=A0A485LNU8_9STRA|nr:hypothetical protein As57867_023488 [Aphanomyces stellatus]VFU00204.1 Aste57867_23559 [Aphanomyces stellatus]